MYYGKYGAVTSVLAFVRFNGQPDLLSQKTYFTEEIFGPESADLRRLTRPPSVAVREFFGIPPKKALR